MMGGGEGGHLRAVPGDPIERRAAFEAAHPEITISPPGRHDPFWTARQDDGSILASAYMLAKLLDTLARLLGEDQP